VDLSCAIAPLDVVQRMKSPGIVIADTRTATEFGAFHLAGAMNMALTSVHSMGFLKNKTVILIGNGKAERELYAACGRLKTYGFQGVRVLRGGMPAWLATGQPVLGRPSDADQSPQLTPTELWIESRFDSNLVLASAGREDMGRLLPSAVAIPDTSAAALRKAIERRRAKAPAALVLILPQDTNAQVIADLRLAIQPIPLLTYTDTTEAYNQQLTQQKAIWAAHERGPKQPTCGH
jgi:rhodanese-related sulfurtransferase